MNDEKKPDTAKDKKNEPEKSEFVGKKHIGSALTWFICAALLVPCFLETRIWAMAALVPVLVILGVGALLESKRTKIKIDNNLLLIEDGSGFKRIERKLDVKKAGSLIVDLTKEKKEDLIHSIALSTKDGKVLLPDVDDKKELLEQIKKIKPSLQINEL